MLPTLLDQEPCPHCGNDKAVFQSGTKVCYGCRLTTTQAEAQGKIRGPAKRDGNGSLLCQKCGDPFPYAVPDDYGNFICKGCKTV